MGPGRDRKCSKKLHIFCLFQGQFIQTYQYGGDFYGLQMESVECVAREGLACAVHMELEVQ